MPTPFARTRASLRWALLAWLTLPLLVLVPLAAAVIYGLAVRPALESLDRALTDTAVALNGMIEQREGQPVLALSEQTRRALRADLIDDVSFAVGDGQGTLLGGDASLLSLARPVAAGAWLFFDTTLKDKPVRVAIHGAACGPAARVCPVLVAESLGKRRDAEHAVAVAALAAAMLIAATLVLLALLAVRRGLRPLREAATQIESRSLQRLEPIDIDGMPREVVPFVAALNDLFARLREASAAQRAFVENASHQLRTPLATLLSESSQALEQPAPPELRATLERLQGAAERGAHLSQQLLTLARTEGARIEGGRSPSRVDLADLAADAADDWLRPSLARRQDLGFELEAAPVLGDALLLRELIGNLIHNALEHAGHGARVTVRTRVGPEGAVLEVEDDGPGLPAEERTRVWARFQRGRHAGGTGSGLGLAIVHDIAQVHRGRAELLEGAQGRGVLARVTLPVVPA